LKVIDHISTSRQKKKMQMLLYFEQITTTYLMNTM